MILEIAFVVFMAFVFLYVITILANEGEAECVEELDECLEEWETIKERWD